MNNYIRTTEGVIVILIFTLILFLFIRSIGAENEIKIQNQLPNNLWKGLIAEAVSEGYEGRYAVACVYRNRLEKEMSLGCVGLKRKDLDEFVDKQGELNKKIAKRIVYEVFILEKKDTTNGATHYENVEKFGKPYWVKDMEITCKIGHHTFYKEKE